MVHPVSGMLLAQQGKSKYPQVAPQLTYTFTYTRSVSNRYILKTRSTVYLSRRLEDNFPKLPKRILNQYIS